ncbi:hypothetical protein SLEP1_g60097 [Rubroshorea leprosula]|uniref:Uncharacterized protein n=1 Tax=Rubroshorea leprosula TaxID=152421 RepID=A0AAV5MUA0_9ROSI|nr:hypothetical protein SLEP1_g60097 [Rubroshorea leprosula]
MLSTKSSFILDLTIISKCHSLHVIDPRCNALDSYHILVSGEFYFWLNLYYLLDR